MTSSRRKFVKFLAAAGLGKWAFDGKLGGITQNAHLASGAGKTANSAASQTDPDEVAKQVLQEFLHAWNGYKQYAWGHDELRPLSKSYRDWHSVPLYMTPVD